MNPDPRLATYVLSAYRPDAVSTMTKHLAGMGATWLVPPAQVEAYRRAGALRVFGVPGGLPAQRNAALHRAHSQNKWCVQLDDDLKRLRHYDGATSRPITLSQTVRMIAAAMATTGAKYGGVSPTDNRLNYRRPVTTWGFVIGCLTVTAPCPQRYDPDMRLKQDWDYTCQHLDAYGVVARRDDVLATFSHYTNQGGVNAYRTHDLETRMANRLLDRWPNLLAPHAKRAHELRLLPAKATTATEGH